MKTTLPEKFYCHKKESGSVWISTSKDADEGGAVVAVISMELQAKFAACIRMPDGRMLDNFCRHALSEAKDAANPNQ